MDKELVVVKGKVIEQQKSYTSTGGKNIDFEVGAKMAKNHYDQYPDQAIATFIGRDIIADVLAQPGCIGLRVFNGINELGIKTPIFVGVDKNGNNILQIDTTKKGIVATGVKICPPYCGATETEETSTSSDWW